jgi:hypothetical protein
MAPTPTGIVVCQNIIELSVFQMDFSPSFFKHGGQMVNLEPPYLPPLLTTLRRILVQLLRIISLLLQLTTIVMWIFLCAVPVALLVGWVVYVFVAVRQDVMRASTAAFVLAAGVAIALKIKHDGDI